MGFREASGLWLWTRCGLPVDKGPGPLREPLRPSVPSAGIVLASGVLAIPFGLWVPKLVDATAAYGCDSRKGPRADGGF